MALKQRRGSLKKLVEAFRRAGSGATVRAAAAVIRTVAEARLRATLSAGQSPSGRSWAPRADGGRALAGWGSLMHVRSSERGFVVSIEDRIRTSGGKPLSIVLASGARRRGTKWRLPKRGMLPARTVPAKWIPAIRTALREEIQREFA